MKIDWNKTRKEDGRYVITDACTACYVSEEQIPATKDKIMSMPDVARDYAKTYDHNGNDDDFCVAEIEDLQDGECHRFAFDGHGRFEWDTERQG